MSQVLRSKNLATKFQILVEIAASQPNMQQRDIARKLELTPQAISEYIRELITDGLVTSDRRSRYRVTKEGVNWILEIARELSSYSTFIGKAVTSISVSTAIAGCNLSAGQPVGLRMEGGLLLASDNLAAGAKGVAVSEVKTGDDVGISNIEGIVNLEIGKITILKVPGIQRGGSKGVVPAKLKKEIDRKVLIGAIGIEALITLRQIGVEPHYFYGVKEAVVEAAYCGLFSIVLCVDDEISGLLRRLEEENLSYRLLDLTKS